MKINAEEFIEWLNGVKKITTDAMVESAGRNEYFRAALKQADTETFDWIIENIKHGDLGFIQTDDESVGTTYRTAITDYLDEIANYCIKVNEPCIGFAACEEIAEYLMRKKEVEE